MPDPNKPPKIVKRKTGWPLAALGSGDLRAAVAVVVRGRRRRPAAAVDERVEVGALRSEACALSGNGSERLGDKSSIFTRDGAVVARGPSSGVRAEELLVPGAPGMDTPKRRNLGDLPEQHRQGSKEENENRGGEAKGKGRLRKRSREHRRLHKKAVKEGGVSPSSLHTGLASGAPQSGAPHTQPDVEARPMVGLRRRVRPAPRAHMCRARFRSECDPRAQ